MRIEVQKPIAELFSTNPDTFEASRERRNVLRKAIACQTISRHDATNLVRLEFADLAEVALAQAARRMGGGVDPTKLLPTR